MSVYSGFATRVQQTKYNTLLETLVIALKKRVIKFYKGQACDQDKFKLAIKKIYKKMYLLQKGKFMVPKYTSCFTDLIDSLNIDINFDSLSQTSSRISGSFSLHGPTNQQQQTPFKSRIILQTKKISYKLKLNKMGLILHHLQVKKLILLELKMKKKFNNIEVIALDLNSILRNLKQKQSLDNQNNQSNQEGLFICQEYKIIYQKNRKQSQHFFQGQI